MVQQATGIGDRNERFFFDDQYTAAEIDGGGGNDVIIGSQKEDTLIGGHGSDVVAGSLSNDILFGDTLADAIGAKDLLLGMDGDDQIFGGAGGDWIAGGGDRDHIYGEAGRDLILGGDGSDTIDGGAGNDRLYGGSVNRIWHTDCRVDYDGVTGQKFKAPISAPMAFGDDGYNDTSADTIDGGSGNDRIFGGLGNDKLTGGSGKDHFVFDSALDAATNVDLITDFSAPADTIDLSHAIFHGLGPKGVLADAAFHIGVAAGDADDRIIYDDTTGALSYDRDGSGSVYAPVRFATVGAHLDLTHADFLVI